MEQRLRLEGPSIDALLERVRDEHGPQARIIHAEQHRVGGVGGFFARRQYELGVEVDGVCAPEPADPGSTSALRTPGSAAEAPRERDSLDVLLDVADRQDGRGRRPAAAAPAVHTTEPAPDRLPQGRPVSTQSPVFEELLRDLVARAGQDGAPADDPRSAPAAPFVRATPVALTGPARRPQHAADPDQQPVPDDHPPPATSERPVTWPRLAALGASPLAVAGVVAAGPGVADEQQLLMQLIAGVAVGPSRPPVKGTVLIVGEAEAARGVAQAWCEDAGIGAHDVLSVSAANLAPARLAQDVAVAQGRAETVVVLIETGPTRASARVAGRLAARLGVGPLVAVVDATRDVAVTLEWIAALEEGGRVVAQVAAHSVAESPTPLRLTSLGRPVTWLDGRPATVGAWAAPCLDRWESTGA